MVLNHSQFAEFLGVTEETIRLKQAEGLPFEAGAIGTANRYSTPRVVEWLIQQALVKAGRSKTALELEALELDVREKRAKDALREKTLAAAAFLSNAHSRLAGELEAAPGIEGKREVLRSAFHQFLTHLGVNGELIQGEVERLLASLTAEQAADCMRRIGADQSTPPETTPL